MRSTPRRSTRRRKRSNRLFLYTLIIIIIGLMIGGSYFLKEVILDNTDQVIDDPTTQTELDSNDTSNSESNVETPAPEPEPEETFTDIRIAAAGDIMLHTAQIESAYDAENDVYNFTPVFEDVKPILSAADLTLANFETTTAGPDRGYTGYPMFNSPDEVIDAISYAGIDVLTTANNHSLDTGREGLKQIGRAHV